MVSKTTHSSNGYKTAIQNVLKRRSRRLLKWGLLALCSYSVLWIILSQLIVNGGLSERLWKSPVGQHDEEFSACLLVMDDSHFLPEWLAYHYHAVNLRTLIVVVDPQSQTSPKPILDKWGEMIDITIWKDHNYMSRSEYFEALHDVQAYFAGSKISPSLARHRTRQRMFYYKCLQTLQQQGKHWTLLIDTDEYLTLNYETIRTHNLTKGLLMPDAPGAVAHFLHEHTTHVPKVQQLSDNLPLYLLQSSPCVQVPRIRFGSAQESPPDRIQHLVPAGYNGSDFLTLRWRSHTQSHDYKNNRIAKAILDLSRIPADELIPVDSIHLPVRSLCEQRRLHTRTPQSLLVIHHYLGTFEQYTYRENDARMGKERSERKWHGYNNIANPQTDDDEIRPWLQGFHNRHPDSAPLLLEGAGQLLPKSWTTYMGNPNEERCAFCFFGLPRAYKSMVLPSIVVNVLIPNARHNCDVYVHFYEQYEEAAGRKNRGGKVDPGQIYLLEQAVHAVQKKYGPPEDARTYRTPTVSFTFDTEEQFWEKRQSIVNKYQDTTGPNGKPKYFPYLARTYRKSSIDNIVKQWHSIQMAFKLMQVSANQLGVNYTRVAMLRSDVMYLTPVDIALMDQGVTDSQNQFAVVPGFAQMPVNDRMVYGPFEAVKTWATRRFDLIEERANQPQAAGYVLHSERFLNESVFSAIQAQGYEVNVNNDICFVRTRADESAMVSDCQMGGTTRGWENVNRRARVESIVGRNCTRFTMGAQWVYLGCGEGVEYTSGK